MSKRSKDAPGALSAVASWDHIPAGELAGLEHSYTFKERAEVLRFLDEYPFLVPLLLEAPPKIEDHFPESPLFLTVLADPEVGDDAQLVLSIGVDFPPDQALLRLQQLDIEWWLDSVSQTEGRLCIDVEYR